MATSSEFPQTLRGRASRSALLVGALAGLAASALLQAAESRTAPAGLSATQIADKSIAARGGLPAWRGLQTLSVSGKLEAGRADSIDRALKVSRSTRGPTRKLAAQVSALADDKAAKQVELPFLMEMKRPDRSRIEIEFAGHTAVQVYDGTQGWKLRPFLNRNDAEPFTAEETKAESGRGDFVGPLLDYAAMGTRVELEKIEPVEGHDAYKLRLTLKNGTVRHVWIDTHSFLEVKVEGTPRPMDGKMHNVWIYQRDFRPVQGLMLPFVLETAVEGYPDTHRMLIEKATVNPKLDDARFGKPHA
jgi:hypothetical protein